MTEPPSSASTAEEALSPEARSSGPVYPGAPRWVKVGAIVAVALVLIVVLAMVVAGGEHGPMRHMPSASSYAPMPTAAGLQVGWP